MPILSGEAGVITGVVAAVPGWQVDAYAPLGAGPGQIPAPSHVVAWALIDAGDVPGGGVVQPVFLAGGRTWTPDQYRAAYGETLDLVVVPA